MAKIHTPIPALKLNDGHSIPMLAYGTGTAWYKTGDESKIDRATVDAVKMAIELEYFHLDGAEMYKTETEVGMAIKESKVDRSKLFVTTKVLHDFSNIERSLRTSLKKLQLDYADLYLIHAPFELKSDGAIQAAWAQMEKVKELGLTRSIGVSNFTVAHLKTLMQAAKIPPAVNQIEFNPYLQSKPLIDFHKEHHIATEAYAPLAPVTKAPGPLDGLLERLARKYAVNPAEILLRWCVEQDIVPITTSSKEQRLSDYLRSQTMRLTPKEVEDIAKVGEEKKLRQFWRGKINDADN